MKNIKFSKCGAMAKTKMKKIEIVAEIGWDHMGNINLAERMIKMASLSGAHYAKFQTWQVKNFKKWTLG